MRQGIIKHAAKNKTLLLMLAPAVLQVFIFSYLPMGGIVMAFKEFQYRLGIFRSPWVGFDNFRFFFLSGQAFNVSRNTILYNLAFITINTCLEVGFAIILSELTQRHFKKVAQSVMFLPYFVSWVIAGSIAYNIFNYENGSMNGLLKFIGLAPVNIYNMPGAWKFILIVFKAWKGVGYGMVVYLASIVSIDAEQYQAAEIDGANIFQRIRHITLPSILPTMAILVLMAVGQIFRGDFGLFYQLVGNNGNLFDSTDIIDTFVFRSLIQSSEVGMAAAAGFYQSVMCFFTITIVNFIVKKVQPDYALF